MDFHLTGRTAIVTGASRGIGKACARALALEGVDVALVSRTPEPLEAAARELSRETGRRILAVPAGTASDESVRAMVRQVADAFGRIDILVNGAARSGGFGPGLAELTDEAFWDDINTKALGYIRCARAVAVEQYGARFIVRGGRSEALEGQCQPHRLGCCSSPATSRPAGGMIGPSMRPS